MDRETRFRLCLGRFDGNAMSGSNEWGSCFQADYLSAGSWHSADSTHMIRTHGWHTWLQCIILYRATSFPIQRTVGDVKYTTCSSGELCSHHYCKILSLKRSWRKQIAVRCSALVHVFFRYWRAALCEISAVISQSDQILDSIILYHGHIPHARITHVNRFCRVDHTSTG